MNWHDGLTLIWHCMVMGSSHGKPKLNFIFVVFSFGLKLKG